MLDGRAISIQMIEGELQIEKLALTFGEETKLLDWSVTASPNAAAIKSI